MMNVLSKWSIELAVLLGCWLAAALAVAPARAQTAKEFHKLNTECWDLMRAGKYAEAERLAERLHRWAEGPLAAEPLRLADACDRLGSIYWSQGRHAEAEVLLKQGLDIRCTVRGREHWHEHWDLLDGLGVLARFYCAQDRYAEAEPLYRQAVEGYERRQAYVQLASSARDLAFVYRAQGRYAAAEPLYRYELELWSRVSADLSRRPLVAASLSNLADLYAEQGRYAQAEPLYRQALEINRKGYGEEDPTVATSINNLANFHADQGRYAEAEPLYRQILAIRRKARGHVHPDVASSLNSLANLYLAERRYAEAEPLMHEAGQIVQRGLCDAELFARIHGNRARLFWYTDRKPKATDVLEKALQTVEQQPTQAARGKHRRAEFSGWTNLFELMVAWQYQQDAATEVFEAIERWRARSLLYRMQAAGADLLAGMAREKAQELRRPQSEAAGRVAELRKQIEVLSKRSDLSHQAKEKEQQRLLEELRQAQLDYTRAYAEMRSASPTYRLAISGDQKSISAEELGRWVEEREALLLQYLLGDEAGYVYVQPAGGEPRVVKLELTTEQAAALGVEPGPLTAERMQEILMREDQTGVLDHLRASRDPRRQQQAAEGLAVLWELLLPAAEREAIVQGKYQRLILLPDAALALLPFETLVVEPSEDPKYLLDVGPPIIYAPSATILVNLAERQDDARRPAEQPVLTVGDCRYGPPATPRDTLLAGLAPQTRYGALGGRLEPLKYAAWEVQWVGDVFGRRGVPATLLRKDAARESSVRQQAPGRRVLHFATHGLVDQQYGNLFGALALTPGSRPDDPADDGFLTLAEIYELDLAGCELAILSACDTNIGPQQRGEGVWTLARGFLTAGARRVAATNWLLDDQAAASTVSYFCSGIAQQKASGEPVDYAAALHAAKRWARSQEKWSAPYYWAPMVLIGPN